jgi:hypothetical protein
VEGVWWQLEPSYDTPTSLEGFTVRYGQFRSTSSYEFVGDVGRLAGPALAKARPNAFGPSEGVIGIAFWNGLRSEVHLASAVTGLSSKVLETRDIVHAGALTREGVYLLTVDPSSRMPKGVFHARQSGGERRLIEADLGRTFQHETARLWVTPDQSRLVVAGCDQNGCDARVLTIDGTAAPLDISVTDQAILGVTDQAILFGRACDRPCRATSVDLEIGRRSPLGTMCSTAIGLTTVDGGTVLAAETGTDDRCSRDRLRIEASELDGVPGPRVVADLPKSLGGLVPLDEFHGFALPPSWLVIGPDGAFVDVGRPDDPRPPMLLNVTDGTLVPGVPVEGG